ncbi:unnamed protein product [Strongylus vulgaris]|uniref:Uncharacterized protein n=1 Tax=Strongylus vulgaris TaxID=40348 RepID=A0A3P7JM49_STRVU|nr:unnamed protein product [Strongylus vulgaris]
MKRAYGDRKACPFDESEDVGMGRCLQSIEIYPHDTRNEHGQQRFHTYRPDDMFHGKIADEWHYYKQINGHNWIAPELITLHHLSPDEIRTYDDLLYRMRSPQLSKLNKSPVSQQKEEKITPETASDVEPKLPKDVPTVQRLLNNKLEIRRVAASNTSNFDIEEM